MNYFDFGLDAYITEAFYGKDKRFLKCEEALEMLRNEIDNGVNRQLDKHEGNILLQKTLCDIFGFKKMLIHWDTSIRMKSSNMTLPTSAVVTVGKTMMEPVSYDKIPYDKDHQMTCIMDCSMTLFKYLTNAQIMAIILHETGHNFEFNPYKALQMLAATTYIMCKMKQLLKNFSFDAIEVYIEELMHTGNTIAKKGFTIDRLKIFKKYVNRIRADLQNKRATLRMLSIPILNILSVDALKPFALFVIKLWDNIVQSNPVFTALSRACGKAGLLLDRWKTVYYSIANISDIPNKLLRAPYMQLLYIPVYKGEKFADSIAAAFGYGSELAEALKIISNSQLIQPTKNNQTANKFIRFLDDISQAHVDLIEMMYCDHGTDMNRTKNMIDSLYDSLGDTELTSEQKKELKIEIQKLENVYAGFAKLNEDEQFSLVVAMRSIVMKYFNGSLSIWDRILPDINL